jgi:hypothetical protein
MRKQKAEEIIWDTLHDVVFLRTGNGLAVAGDDETKTRDSSSSTHHKSGLSTQASVSSDSRRSGSRMGYRSQGYRSKSGSGRSHQMHHHPNSSGMVNPFVNPNGTRRFATDEDIEDSGDGGGGDDNRSVDSTGSGASIFSLDDEDGDEQHHGGAMAAGDGASVSAGTHVTSSTSATSKKMKKRVMIPIPLIEAELDLEEDERRCLEEIALSNLTSSKYQQQHSLLRHSHHRQRQLPRYADPVLALRILVECLAKLKRLDDVERVIAEGLDREIQRIIQREQARTFYRLEKKRTAVSLRTAPKNTAADNSSSLHEFRQHLTGLLSAFGCVMVRLSHLAVSIFLDFACILDLQFMIFENIASSRVLLLSRLRPTTGNPSSQSCK